MTTVEIVFRYAAPPTDAVTRALADTREVYGIRRRSNPRQLHSLTPRLGAAVSSLS